MEVSFEMTVSRERLSSESSLSIPALLPDRPHGAVSASCPVCGWAAECLKRGPTPSPKLVAISVRERSAGPVVPDSW